jgi:hypothetical protein
MQVQTLEKNGGAPDLLTELRGPNALNSDQDVLHRMARMLSDLRDQRQAESAELGQLRKEATNRHNSADSGASHSRQRPLTVNEALEQTPLVTELAKTTAALRKLQLEHADVLQAHASEMSHHHTEYSRHADRTPESDAWMASLGNGGVSGQSEKSLLSLCRSQEDKIIELLQRQSKHDATSAERERRIADLERACNELTEQPQHSGGSETQFQSRLAESEDKLAFVYKKLQFVTHRCKLLDRTCRALLDANHDATEQELVGLPLGGEEFGSPMSNAALLRAHRQNTPLALLQETYSPQARNRSPLRPKKDLPDARRFLALLKEQKERSQGQ